MSYNITVTATGGELTVTSSGDVPDGKHQISGHVDATQINLGVNRVDADGKTILQASSWRSKEA